MLYYQFKNYDEFKEIFAVEKRNNGTEVRKNKILLSHLKNADLLRFCHERNDFTLLNIKDMAQLQQVVTDAVCSSGKQDDSLPHRVELIGRTYCGLHNTARMKPEESVKTETMVPSAMSIWNAAGCSK